MSSRAGSKMTIRPYKVQSLMSRADAEKLWVKLEIAIDEIYKRNSSTLYFEELYRTAYNLVLQKHGDLLYKGVCDSFESHSQAITTDMLKVADSTLLADLCVSWEDNKTTITKIKDIVMYMDKTLILHQKLVSVFTKGVSIFRNCVIYDVTIRDKLHRFLLENILAERNGEIIDTETIKGVLNMLIELGVDGERVYETDFEELFLSATKSFYREEYLSYSAQFSCPEYIKKVEVRFLEEAKRVNHYLSKTTEPKLRAILNSELISDHAESLVEMEYSGCRNMMKENQIDNLKGLFDLLNRVPICLEYLHSCMGAYIRTCGNEIVAHHDNPKDNQPVVFVQSVIQLKNKFDNIVKLCFQNESKSLLVLKDSFEHFLNKNNRTAAFLAYYFDDLLKSGLKGCTEIVAEEKIEQAIAIFRLIHDKDVFESYYKNHLSKRLLSKKYSDELEKNVISKLKSECGCQYTGKIEGMFVDVRISNTLFEDYITDQQLISRTMNDGDNIEFDATVLTNGMWPATSAKTTCVLPRVILEKCLDPFTAFYVKKHSGRKLSWQMHLGAADVRGKFGKERRDLGVSTYQMCMLMLFNEVGSDGGAPTLSLSQIRDSLQIPELDLKRHLLSLCTPKYRILKKSKGKGIDENDTFAVNFAFTSKLRRIKIPLVSAKDVSGGGDKGGSAQGENFDQLPANVIEDRRHIIEAALVRIMKARKTLSHNNLIAEVLRQVSHRFTVEVTSLKKRIESLIEREYIMRDPEDRKIYKYLA